MPSALGFVRYETAAARFGEKFVCDDHRVRFAVSCSGDLMDRVLEKGIERGDRIRFGASSLRVKDAPTSDGKVYLKIGCRGVGNPKIISKKTPDDSIVNTAPDKPAPDTAEASPEETAVKDGKEYCPDCGKEIAGVVAAYCDRFPDRFHGRHYCRSCQKNHATEASNLPDTQNDFDDFGYEDLTLLNMDDSELPF